MATTNDGHEAPEPGEPNQRFADRLRSYNEQPLTESELDDLPEGIRQRVVREAEIERRAEDAMIDRVTARTRAAIRADRAAKRATQRLGAKLLHGVQEAIEWCRELFDAPPATAMSWSNATIPLVVEDEDGGEREFEAQLPIEARRTARGTLQITLRAPITDLPGWNGANAILFLGPAPDPAQWRSTWIAMPRVAERQGDAALLEYEFELTPHQGGLGSDAKDAPVSPRAIRQIRLFPLRG